jgi:iron complex outermembrane receptor protein
MITKTNTPTFSAGWLSRWMGICTLALLTALNPSLRAQTGSTGTVTGTVLDSSSGKYLEGAEVSIESQGVSLRTNSERGGAFSLSGVPAGPQTLVVAYPGLESKSESVTVVAGQSVAVQVSLAAETIMLEALTVSTAKEGMSQAQALQKASIQFKVVAANDQFGEISEGNIGEYLKFLPGVGIDYNSNDARGVSLRGLRTQFTLVAVDGTPMASAASGGVSRRFELEQIAMNNIETTEVYKTVTPDIQADATGGMINMVTKSAFDRKDVSLFSYNLSLNVPSSRVGAYKEAGTYKTGNQRVVSPNLELNYARRLNEKIGFNVNYRFSEIYHDSPRTEYTWRATGTGFSVADPTLATYNQNNEQKLTHRESFGTKVDYKISDDTKLTVSAQWNWYDLTFTQRRMQYTLGATGQTNPVGANLSTSGTSGLSVGNSFQQRNKYGTTLHGNVRLDHNFANDSKAWLIGYWSKSNSKYRDGAKGFAAETTATLNGVTAFSVNNVMDSPRLPTVNLNIPFGNSRSISNYTFSGNNSASFRSRPLTAYDTKIGGQGNYSYTLQGIIPIKLQAGAAYDIAEREIVDQEIRIASGGPTLTGAALANYREDHLFDFDFGYGPVETLNPYRLYADYFAAAAKRPQTDTYRLFEEKNLAGYALADAKFFQDLTFVGGVRWEKREIDALGQARASATSRIAKYDISYDNWYPSATLRYNPSALKKIVARAGVSKTVGHPEYSDILPTVDIPLSGGTGTITTTDENLKPYYLTNYDVGVEYYPSKSGVIAATLFHKKVKGFIVSQSIPMSSAAIQQYITQNGFDPADFVNTPNAQFRTNGKGSELTGIELQYNQNFSFLPAPFKGLSLQTNYTKIDIDGDDLATQYEQELSAVTESINVILGYRQGRFNTTISNNWTTDVLVTNASPLLTYKSPELKTSIKLEYSVNRHYNIYAEARNIFYEREEYYQGYALTDRHVALPGRSFEYGDPIYVIGVKGTF